jgi:hypothetical protein
MSPITLIKTELKWTYLSPFHAISFSNNGKNCKNFINIRWQKKKKIKKKKKKSNHPVTLFRILN